VISKDDFGRGLLTAMHAGGTVGILMDTNMTPPQGEFVKFFRHRRLHGNRPGAHRPQNWRRGAAGLHVLGADGAKYVLRFGPEVEIPRRRCGRGHSGRHAAGDRGSGVVDSALS
jgi:Kdo2-lipid IVA lauroyltransferase/acyltransferase